LLLLIPKIIEATNLRFSPDIERYTYFDSFYFIDFGARNLAFFLDFFVFTKIEKMFDFTTEGVEI